jgi:hypothetical protein
VSDTVAAAARRVATEWKGEAEKRRRVSRHDPVADTLEFCASELSENIRAVDGPGATRTVEQYARDHGVTPQTVCRWIRRKELEAEQTPHGYRIARSAVRRRKRRGAAA